MNGDCGDTTDLLGAAVSARSLLVIRRVADGTRRISVSPQSGQEICLFAICWSKTDCDWNQPSKRWAFLQIRSKIIIESLANQRTKKLVCTRHRIWQLSNNGLDVYNSRFGFRARVAELVYAADLKSAAF